MRLYFVTLSVEFTFMLLFKILDLFTIHRHPFKYSYIHNINTVTIVSINVLVNRVKRTPYIYTLVAFSTTRKHGMIPWANNGLV